MADIALANQRLLDVATSLYESRFKDYFDMRKWATKDGYPCCSLANYAYRDDLQDLLGIERDEVIYISGVKAGDGVHWGDDILLDWFSVNWNVAHSVFGASGLNSIESETADQAGDFIKRLVARRQDNGV